MSVVVAYSPSDQGRAALRAGVREARQRDLPLVVASHSFADGEAGRTTADDAEIRDELASIAGEPVPDVRVRRSDAEDVGEFLLGVAADEEASLLVIGLRGKSPSGKLALGATARRVVLASPCAVLAVRDDCAPA